MTIWEQKFDATKYQCCSTSMLLTPPSRKLKSDRSAGIGRDIEAVVKQIREGVYGEQLLSR